MQKRAAARVEKPQAKSIELSVDLVADLLKDPPVQGKLHLS